MKQFIAFGFCLLAVSPSFAQKTTTTTKTTTTKQTVTKTTKPMHGTAIGGSIRDARFHPLAGVETFVYSGDSSSSIIASAFTDEKGLYETNGVMSGKYDLKVVYPTNKAIIVKGVPVKSGVTQINLNVNPPDADTTLLYAELVPKVETKKKAK